MSEVNAQPGHSSGFQGARLLRKQDVKKQSRDHHPFISPAISRMEQSAAESVAEIQTLFIPGVQRQEEHPDIAPKCTDCAKDDQLHKKDEEPQTDKQPVQRMCAGCA